MIFSFDSLEGAVEGPVLPSVDRRRVGDQDSRLDCLREGILLPHLAQNKLLLLYFFQEFEHLEDVVKLLRACFVFAVASKNVGSVLVQKLHHFIVRSSCRHMHSSVLLQYSALGIDVYPVSDSIFLVQLLWFW